MLQDPYYLYGTSSPLCNGLEVPQDFTSGYDPSVNVYYIGKLSYEEPVPNLWGDIDVLLFREDDVY